MSCLCFKQKTAYELRISDLSSDVCSSDLIPIRVMHLQIPDASTASNATSYAERVRQLQQFANIELAVEGWLRTATRMLALGWLPTDPASLGRGNCLMPDRKSVV